MYELIQTGENTWYMAAPTNVGFFRSGGEVCMIDGGGDREAAERALEHIRAQGWRLTRLLLTHSHADHTGGAAHLRAQTGCRVFAPGISAAALSHSFLIPVTLYGGSLCPEMCSRLLRPEECPCQELTQEDLPAGMSFVRLDGHDMAQAAYKTTDGVWFTGDAVIGREALKKHRISFIHDPGEHLRSLKALEELSGELFVPAHDHPCVDILPLAAENRAAVLEVAEDIVTMCAVPQTLDELTEKALERYHIRLYMIQYLLVGQTVRSYVSWLVGCGRLRPEYTGTRLTFSAAETRKNESAGE